jgi:RNase adaptor protein for sRNA GlmZ degradation
MNTFRLQITACGTNYGEVPPCHKCYYLGHHNPWAKLYGVAGRKPVINPHYDPCLRPLNGRDRTIQDYIFADAEAQWRRQRIDEDLVVLFESIRSGQRRWIPELVCAEGEVEELAIDDTYVIVTLCTGGKHRSQTFAVYISEKASELAKVSGVELMVSLAFRDDGRE